MSASVAGSAHARDGLPCQDSLSTRPDARDGVLVASVADGAGSAGYAHFGSGIAAAAAVQTATRLVRLHTLPIYEAVLSKILSEAVHSARNRLESEAHRSDKDLGDFATTLIVAICTPDMAATAQVGDGAVVTADATSQEDSEYTYELFSRPQRGEYANETNFITSKVWRNYLDINVRRGHRRYLAMFTDGLQSLALSASDDLRPHAPFFTPLFQWAEKQSDQSAAGDGLEAFLSSSRVTDRTDDDLTLLVATLPK